MEALKARGITLLHHCHHPRLRGRAAHPLISGHPLKSPPYVHTLPFVHARGVQPRALSSERHGQGPPFRAVPVQVAHELLNAGHRYLDVRTAEEFAAGHIEGAVNVPYMYKVGPGMTKNLRFLEDVGENFGKDDEVVVGCQMGKRSQMAAGELVAAGFTGITDMAGGYMAWVQSGMPTKAAV